MVGDKEAPSEPPSRFVATSFSLPSPQKVILPPLKLFNVANNEQPFAEQSLREITAARSVEAGASKPSTGKMFNYLLLSVWDH